MLAFSDAIFAIAITLLTLNAFLSFGLFLLLGLLAVMIGGLESWLWSLADTRSQCAGDTQLRLADG